LLLLTLGNDDDDDDEPVGWLQQIQQR